MSCPTLMRKERRLPAGGLRNFSPRHCCARQNTTEREQTMSKEIKDTADLFAAEGEEAREILEGLKEQAKDALGLVISEAPAEGDFLGCYRHFKERELPLIMRLEDPGERRAVLEDIAKAHELKVSDLRKALSAAEKRAQEAAVQEDLEDGGAQDETLAPEPGTERHERAMR